MAKKGNSIIKGLDINEIITRLNKAYADEWLAYYQYFIEGKVIKGIMKDAAIAELQFEFTLRTPLPITEIIVDGLTKLGFFYRRELLVR